MVSILCVHVISSSVDLCMGESQEKRVEDKMKMERRRRNLYLCVSV